MALPTQQTSYTVTEIAQTLQISTEAIRQKIINKEIKAIEVVSKPRKQYRILHSELVNWLGDEVTKELFAPEFKPIEPPRILQDMDLKEIDEIINEAKAWNRATIPEPKLTGKSATSKEITERFPKGNKVSFDS